MKILVTGAHGQLGHAMTRQLGEQAIPMDSTALDVTDAESVRETIRRVKPWAIVNCAAYTNVDQAELEGERCAQVNSRAVSHLADAAEQCGAVLVQISTDYVFGGDPTRHAAYQESDDPDPQSVYARTKLQGERNAALCEKHFIVRTCGLYGASSRRNNFVEKMLQMARQLDRVRVVDDQQCTPTFACHLARAIHFLLGQSSYGTYHIVNSGQTSWYAFAKQIFQLERIDVHVEPITTAEFRARAQRPCFSVLDTTKYHSLGGPPMPHWTDALQEYLAMRQ